MVNRCTRILNKFVISINQRLYPRSNIYENDDQWSFSSIKRRILSNNSNDTLVTDVLKWQWLNISAAVFLFLLSEISYGLSSLHMVRWSNNNHRHWFVEKSSEMMNKSTSWLIFSLCFLFKCSINWKFASSSSFFVHSLKKISRVCDNNLWSLTAAFVFFRLITTHTHTLRKKARRTRLDFS